MKIGTALFRRLLREPRPPRFAMASLLAAATLALLGGIAVWEMRTSTFQARWFASLAAELDWTVEPGPSPSIVFPRSGPYDLRLGYARLPEMIEGAREGGFRIVEQARVSPRFRELVEDRGLFPVYPAKTRAGLALTDRGGRTLLTTPYPARTYSSFESMPQVVWQTLLFIENRTALDPHRPRRNAAVEWHRLFRSIGALALRALGREGNVAGASTLATQLEKLRHESDGVTASPRDKLLQMASASLRSYLDGPETLRARMGIVLDYLNSLPLAAQHGMGEVTGLGDGLWAWYGRDFDEANRILARIPPGRSEVLPDPKPVLPPGVRLVAWEEEVRTGPSAEEGRVYREVLSLLLAQRRPSYHLRRPEGREALARLTDGYLKLLRDAGIISAVLAQAAKEAGTEIRGSAPPGKPVSFAERKGVDAVRTELLGLLGVPRLDELDKLDLAVRTTLDAGAQEATTDLLLRMADPGFVRARGFDGHRLLEGGDPRQVVYSVMVHERTERGNVVRIQADNLDAPFNVNESARLELGSTAKLRTLVSYLEVVAELHGRFSQMSPDSLRGLKPSPNDPLARWVRHRLLADSATELSTLLAAAMERRYSAHPDERFETGGGVQRFSNFGDAYDQSFITVAEAFRRSVNLVFVRLMRDVVSHHIHGTPEERGRVLDDPPDSPLRKEYLRWFADREGTEFLDRFIPKFRGMSRDGILRALVRERGLSPERVAWAYRAAAPGASLEEFRSILGTSHPGIVFPEARIERLFHRADPTPHTLADLGYLAAVHPLELWVARHLIENPGAPRAEIVAAGAQARQDAYAWLFRTSRRAEQDRRIRSLLEIEAFDEIHEGWRRLGYPFGSIVPSLGSAIGSSGDRPSALGELISIIQNDGVRLPTYRVEELHFGKDTPFETRMTRGGAVGERVMAPEVAGVLRDALVEAVEDGTGRRIAGVLRGPDGTSPAVGGKTGTGDNRVRVFGRDGRVVAARSLNRTASFVFLVEDRHYGVVTAYVPGEAAEGYRFTSALAIRLFQELVPVIGELISGPGAEPRAGQFDPVSPMGPTRAGGPGP